MATLQNITLPDIGNFADVAIIEILVAVGDRIETNTSLLTLESDKATMEIPAPLAGQVAEILVKVGDRVHQGSLLLRVASDSAAPAVIAPAQETGAAVTAALELVATAPPRRPAGEKPPSPPPVLAHPDDHHTSKAHASPAVRRFARELGVELARIQGSGPKGRICKEDVQNFVKRVLTQGAGATPVSTSLLAFPAVPEVDFSRFGPIATQPLSRIRKLSGAHLHRCWLSAPQVTQFDTADITELETFRQSYTAADVKLTLLPFLLRACAAALKTLPRFNSSLAANGDSLILKSYVHIGVAVDTPNGLMVPVLRDVDQKSLLVLAKELAAVSARARAGQLSPGDLQGGCFTISSLGGIGGDAFTPIVNLPEVAILGVSRANWQPVWNGRKFIPRRLLPLSLSYDHRVVDGAEGARFTQLLSQLLVDIRRLLL